MEVWKDIKIDGLLNIYQVSNLGNLKSIARTKTFIHPITKKLTTFNFKEVILKPFTSKKGYLRVSLLFENNTKKNFSVHVLVAKTFLNNDSSNKLQVNHINGIKNDNRIENLEWVTQSENSLHAFKLGLQKPKYLENNGNAKKVYQIDLQSNSIVKEWNCMTLIQQTLGYNISNISKVCHGERKQAYGFKWKLSN
jgi:hypothetical protein